MTVRIEGLDEMENLLLKIESEARRRAVGEMIKAGHEIADLAKQMAPVDFGNLEEAIKVEVSSERDSLGRFARREVNVYVDLDFPADDKKPGKTVGDYAYYVHEHMTPYGPGGLGPKSRAKQAASAGVVVGGGYLERAAAQVSDSVAKRVAAATSDYLSTK